MDGADRVAVVAMNGNAMPERNWDRLEDLFTQACDLPGPARADFVARHCDGDAALRDELTDLLRAHDAAGGFLEHLQIKTGGADVPALAAGSRFGAWRVIRSIGRGGMGEVYEVARADAAFAQRAALKLLRHEAAGQIERFHVERSILARLDHPGIARLFDGGVADDGRPWAALEYVEGETITAWCASHQADLNQRLDLFAQVCDAVGYAHRNLIVHRDLKPSNILVDAQGRVRLLDFGIAKLIDPALGNSGETTQMPLTPDYCAPEQLAGEPITTATDLYALGLLLYELLTGKKAWSIQGLPIARAIRTLIEANAPKPSVVALTQADAPVSARLLRGDLDAIVARCLRKEPGLRYPTVDALRQDIERHQQGRTVAARGGARAYVFGRFLQRHKWAVAGVAALILALGAGIAATAWQARRAEQQAARAEAVKNFLIGVFKASDPRIASDKPRGSITARELLDVSASKIEKDFAAQPETKIELLGIVADISCQLEIAENKQCETLRGRYIDTARRHYGDAHPIVVDALLDDAWWAIDARSDQGRSLRLLDLADPLIRQAGMDGAPQRAFWYVIKAYAGGRKGKDYEALLLQAVSLYEQNACCANGYVDALTFLGIFYSSRDDPDRAKEFHLRAKAAIERLPERDDSHAALNAHNLASARARIGDAKGAAEDFGRAANLYLLTYGDNYIWYWISLAQQANVLCATGNRIEAQALFERLQEALPVTPYEQDKNRSYGIARSNMSYGSCLLAQGRSSDAISPLEMAERLYASGRAIDGASELIETRMLLGVAYSHNDRIADARRTLKAALDEELAKDTAAVPSDRKRLLRVRELWGRFLVARNETDEAQAQLRGVLSLDHGRNLAVTAQAHADLALAALQRNDAREALAASTQALEAFERVAHDYDARIAPRLWRIHAQALARNGDLAGARDYAQRALDAFVKYDDPASPAIAESRSVLAEIDRRARN